MVGEGASSQPSGGDGRSGHGAPLRRKPGSLFSWTAMAPSPDEVAGLEREFPDVIQLPTAAVDKETEDWSASGLLLRSLSRWVPPEAVIREFRRAGLSGRIDVITLAHRTFMAKFELLEARNAALKQPWIVNGQPLAVEAWRPNFIPAEDALTAALLWVRLPNLPMEYWSEETLRSILSVAGQVVDVDAFTKERRRGSYARACVRVDLSRPLRPGARIRAHGSPFWQQFAYEHVDCICPSCGSVHLSGSCLSSKKPGSSAVAPLFGPWMAALRQRKPFPMMRMDGVSSDKATTEDFRGKASVDASGDGEGWMKPGKYARRRSVQSSSIPQVAVNSSKHLKTQDPCREGQTVPVTVPSETLEVADPVAQSGVFSSDGPSNSLKMTKGRMKSSSHGAVKVKGKDSGSVFHFQAEGPAVMAAASSVTQTEISGSKLADQKKRSGKVALNPFSLTGSDRWAGCPKTREDANPASLKRARAIELTGTKLAPMGSKGKSRAPSSSKGPLESGVVVPSLESGPQDKDAHEAALSALKDALAASSSVSRGAEPPLRDQSIVVPMEPDQESVQVMGQLPEQGLQVQCTDSGDSMDKGMSEALDMEPDQELEQDMGQLPELGLQMQCPVSGDRLDMGMSEALDGV